MPHEAKPPRQPKLCLHKGTGRGFVRIEGRMIYLGEYGSPECQREYLRILSEWAANGYRLPVDADDVYVAELLDRYLDHAEVHYRDEHGNATSELNNVKRVVAELNALYSDVLVRDFTPLSLKALRQRFVDQGLSRTTCNRHTNTARRIFGWGMGENMVPSEVFGALHGVKPLQRNRTTASETERVKPVDREAVDTTLPFLPKPLQAAVHVMLYTGCRPQEALAMRPCDIEQDGDVWHYIPAHHKLSYLERERIIPIGPRLQNVLRPYLLRPADAHLFSPIEAEAQRYAKCENHRSENAKPSPRKTDRKVRPFYTSDGFRRAVARAVSKANEDRDENDQLPSWAPNQIRHLVASEVRKSHGLDVAQVLLGHSRLTTTQVYSERDMQRAEKAIRDIG